MRGRWSSRIVRVRDRFIVNWYVAPLCPEHSLGSSLAKLVLCPQNSSLCPQNSSWHGIVSIIGLPRDGFYGSQAQSGLINQSAGKPIEAMSPVGCVSIKSLTSDCQDELGATVRTTCATSVKPL